MFQGVIHLILSLVENLGEAEMSRDALWIQAKRVSEILLSLGVVSRVGKLGCKVDSGTEMLLVQRKALLKLIHGLFIHLFLLILDTEVEVRAQVWFWQLDSDLELLDGLVNLLFLLIYLSQGYVRISIFRVFRNSFEQQLLCLIDLAVIFEVEFSKSDEELSVIRVDFIGRQELFESLLGLSIPNVHETEPHQWLERGWVLSDGSLVSLYRLVEFSESLQDHSQFGPASGVVRLKLASLCVILLSLVVIFMLVAEHPVSEQHHDLTLHEIGLIRFLDGLKEFDGVVHGLLVVDPNLCESESGSVVQAIFLQDGLTFDLSPLHPK